MKSLSGGFTICILALLVVTAAYATLRANETAIVDCCGKAVGGPCQYVDNDSRCNPSMPAQCVNNGEYTVCCQKACVSIVD
jgi:hypothetical protein